MPTVRAAAARVHYPLRRRRPVRLNARVERLTRQWARRQAACGYCHGQPQVIEDADGRYRDPCPACGRPATVVKHIGPSAFERCSAGQCARCGRRSATARAGQAWPRAAGPLKAIETLDDEQHAGFA